MNIIYLLIIISVVLLVIISAFFFWAVKSGQFEDLEKESRQILMEKEDTEEERH